MFFFFLHNPPKNVNSLLKEHFAFLHLEILLAFYDETVGGIKLNIIIVNILCVTLIQYYQV